MGEVIVITSGKGGVGKTTTTANIAYSLNSMGKKILAVDTDMQMNLSLSFFEEEEVLGFNTGKNNLYSCLLDGRNLSTSIYKTKYDGLELIPSSMLMSGMEEYLYGKKGNKKILFNALKDIREKGGYDYILMDAPPTLGLWVRNILNVSGGVVIPVEASPWGLFGLANMVDYIFDASKDNKKLKICGIVI